MESEPSIVWLPLASAAFALIKACCLFSQRLSIFKVSPLTQFSFLAVAETTFPVFGFLYVTDTDYTNLIPIFNEDEDGNPLLIVDSSSIIK